MTTRHAAVRCTRRHAAVQRTRRRFLAAAVGATLAAAVLAPAPALAQGGHIAGQVTDAAGDPLLSVIVVADSPERHAGTVTDLQGRYRFAALPAGTYEVTFWRPGLSRVVRDGVDVRASSRTTIDVTLTPDADDSVPAAIGPPRIRVNLPHGLALDCTFEPTGISDCRPVLVQPRVFPDQHQESAQ